MMTMPEVDIPAELPRAPAGESRRRRTEIYLAAATAAKEKPSPAAYRAAALAAMDLSTAYSWVGSCIYGNVWHTLVHVGRELMQRAIAYQKAAAAFPDSIT